jgi:hypothetical protein
MTRLLSLTAVALLACAATRAAWAVQVTQTVTTTASPDVVWSIVGAFPDIATWLPGTTGSEADKGSDIGSVRVITLKAPGDPTITEKLTARDPAAHSYSYDIIKVDPKVLPVSGYSSTITVAAHGSGSKVTWHGSFSAAGGASDAAASKAVTGIYRAGLNHVKSLAETH